MTHPPYRVPFLHGNQDPDLSDLANVPKAYRHDRCGQVTPNDVAITRNIHRYPLGLLAHGNAAGCNHCPKPTYPSREFTWVETDENVQDYFHALIAEEHRARPWGWLKPALREAALIAFVFVAAGFALGVYLPKKMKLDSEVGLMIVVGGIGCALLATVLLMANHFRIRSKYLREYRSRFGAA